ncbi:MAG: phosphopantetheine-binding protein [Planctomycetota bacterium]
MELQQEVADLVGRVIRDSTGRDVEVAPDDRLIESGLLDSLSMVNLVMALQEQYEVSLDINDMNEVSFASAAAIAALVAERRG